MELRPALSDKIRRLLDKGVKFPNALSVDIGDEIDIDRISGDGVKIYPGCRIYGDKTVISAGALIGREGPATIENCVYCPGRTWFEVISQKVNVMSTFGREWKNT